jgi:hypothetical protein
VTVYVDDLFHWPGPVSPAAKGHGRVWCHLMTDSLRLGELHEFAVGIGLKRSWFQNRRGIPHYDLTPGARARAVAAGAAEVSCTGIIRLCRRDPILQ